MAEGPRNSPKHGNIKKYIEAKEKYPGSLCNSDFITSLKVLEDSLIKCKFCSSSFKLIKSLHLD